MIIFDSETVLDAVKDFVCLKIVMDIAQFMAMALDPDGHKEISANKILVKKQKEKLTICQKEIMDEDKQNL